MWTPFSRGGAPGYCMPARLGWGFRQLRQNDTQALKGWGTSQWETTVLTARRTWEWGIGWPDNLGYVASIHPPQANTRQPKHPPNPLPRGKSSPYPPKGDNSAVTIQQEIFNGQKGKEPGYSAPKGQDNLARGNALGI